VVAVSSRLAGRWQASGHSYARTGQDDFSIAAYVGEKGKGRRPDKGAAGIPGAGRQEAFEEESIKQITAYVKDTANSDKLFFIYWAT
jgi:arylsulfatase